MNKIFETVHGSRLYGMAHADSDFDTYTVYADKRKAMQQIDGIDQVHVGLQDFLSKAYSGSHQSLEALFSPVKIYHNHGYAAMLEAAVVPATMELTEKYLRTIHKFSHGDYKRRRHAMRLAVALRDLRRYGRFNPRLSPNAVEALSRMADSFIGEDLYAQALLTTEPDSVLRPPKATTIRKLRGHG